MRFLTVITTPSTVSQLERCVGAGRLRPLAPHEGPEHLGIERFAGVIADQGATVASVRRELPVILVSSLGRPALAHFRSIAEAGVDVRLFVADRGISEPTLHALSAARAPTPASIITEALHGEFQGLAADIMTAAALLADSRRSMDEVARAVDSSSTLVRNALRDAGVIGVSGVMARMRCLHALWACESGRSNFWSSAGFRTLAEVSEFFSRHTGAPIGRWRVAGGFNALLRELPANLREERTLGLIGS